MIVGFCCFRLECKLTTKVPFCFQVNVTSNHRQEEKASRQRQLDVLIADRETPISTLDPKQIGFIQAENIDGRKFARSIAMSADGKRIAVVFKDSPQVRVYDNANDQWVQAGQGIVVQDNFSRTSCESTISGDGNLLAAYCPGSNQIFTYRWMDNIGSWKEIANPIQLQTYSHGRAMSTDGKVLAVGMASGRLMIFRLEEDKSGQNGNVFWDLSFDLYVPDENRDKTIYGPGVAISPDGDRVVFETIRAVEVYEWNVPGEPNVWSKIAAYPERNPLDYAFNRPVIAMSANRVAIADASTYYRVSVYGLTGEQIGADMTSYDGFCGYAPALSADGKYLAVSCSGFSTLDFIYVFKEVNGVWKVFTKIEGEFSSLYLQMSADASAIAIAGYWSGKSGIGVFNIFEQKESGVGGDPHFLTWHGEERESFHGECDLVL